ncbi:MAG: hypothetical protein ACO1SX_05065 [Actinomycetota bacterium]
MSSKEPLTATDQPLPEHLDDFFTPHALECMQRAVAEAVAEHHLLGNPVYIWRDGRVVRLFPDGSTEPVEKTAA